MKRHLRKEIVGGSSLGHNSGEEPGGQACVSAYWKRRREPYRRTCLTRHERSRLGPTGAITFGGPVRLGSLPARSMSTMVDERLVNAFSRPATGVHESQTGHVLAVEPS